MGQGTHLYGRGVGQGAGDRGHYIHCAHVRATFGSSDVEKLHAAVARSTFSSLNRKKLTVSDHFLKFRCGKIARRCGAKHIFKSKCTKHLMGGPLFEVEM